MQSDSPNHITRLTLQQFRNHAEYVLEPRSPMIALVGSNGAGKTNILEAISLLSPGKGLRNASYREMLSQRGAEQATEWVVAAEVAKQGDSIPLGTRFISSAGEKRELRAEGEALKHQAQLTQYLTLVWLTPAMSHLFNEGGTARRKFLDRLVYGFDTEHASRVHAHDYHVRERNRLLSDMARPDHVWLDTLEQKVAESAVAIAVARRDALAHLSTMLGISGGAFPAAQAEIRGFAENLLAEDQSAVMVEEAMREALALKRGDDKRSGRTSLGAHRSEFIVWYAEKEREAAECSTGEQKALLFSLVLAHARARRHWQGTAPILLLDEVVAHLDEGRRAALFDELQTVGAQVFMTGTDATDFAVSDAVEIRPISA